MSQKVKMKRSLSQKIFIFAISAIFERDTTILRGNFVENVKKKSKINHRLNTKGIVS
jgi:hypothetical protein